MRRVLEIVPPAIIAAVVSGYWTLVVLQSTLTGTDAVDFYPYWWLWMPLAGAGCAGVVWIVVMAWPKGGPRSTWILTKESGVWAVRPSRGRTYYDVTWSVDGSRLTPGHQTTPIWGGQGGPGIDISANEQFPRLRLNIPPGSKLELEWVDSSRRSATFLMPDDKKLSHRVKGKEAPPHWL